MGDRIDRPLIDVGFDEDGLGEDKEIVLGLASFFSWLSGKGFSRAGWVINHMHPNRKQRRRQAAIRRRILRSNKKLAKVKLPDVPAGQETV